MMIGFFYENEWLNHTPSASSEHSNFPATNTQNRWPTKTWKSNNGAGSGWGRFIIEAGVNDKIDFEEEDGVELTATLTAGTYDVDTLCAEIKSQLDATGSCTYTVEYIENGDDAKKFKITTDGDGPTYVTNGSFTVDALNWTTQDCTLASIAGGVAGNCCQLTRTGGAIQYFTQTLTCVVGMTYKFSVYVKSGTSGNEAIEIWVNDGGWTLLKATTTTAAWVQHTVYFTAATTSPDICLQKDTATAGTMLFDEIKVCLYGVNFLWDSGTNAATSVGDTIGFDVSADDDDGEIENTADYIRIHTSEAIAEDFGEQIAIRGVFLIGHGFQDGATVRVEASNDNWATTEISISFTIQDNILTLYWDTAYTYRYWRIWIEDVDNPLGYVYIGCIGIYPGFFPARNYHFDRSHAPYDESIVRHSTGGQVSTIQRTKHDGFSIYFDKTDEKDSFDEMWDDRGNWRELIWIEDLTNYLTTTRYVRIGNYSPKHHMGDFWNINMTLVTLR